MMVDSVTCSETTYGYPFGFPSCTRRFWESKDPAERAAARDRAWKEQYRKDVAAADRKRCEEWGGPLTGWKALARAEAMYSGTYSETLKVSLIEARKLGFTGGLERWTDAVVNAGFDCSWPAAVYSP